MNEKATVMMLFIMLLLSSLHSTIAVHSSRSLKSMADDDDNVYNQGKIQFLYDEFQNKKKGRMEMEVYDYSGPGANSHHDPKSPPGKI